jgi:hypothetical protein
MNNPFQSYNRGYTARERRIRRDLGMLLAITGIISVWLAFRTTGQDRTIDELEVTNTTLHEQTLILKNQVDSLKIECNDKDSLLSKRGIITLRNERDYLRGELFNASTVIGRYELSLEYLKESNPKASKEFEKFYNHETE